MTIEIKAGDKYFYEDGPSLWRTQTIIEKYFKEVTDPENRDLFIKYKDSESFHLTLTGHQAFIHDGMEIQLERPKD